MPTLKINEVDLYWELTGRVGEALVLVHGSWGDHHVWDGIVPPLARSFRVLTYDRRGHSRSERPTSQGSIHEDVRDVGALIEHLDLAPGTVRAQSGVSDICRRPRSARPT